MPILKITVDDKVLYEGDVDHFTYDVGPDSVTATGRRGGPPAGVPVAREPKPSGLPPGLAQAALGALGALFQPREGSPVGVPASARVAAEDARLARARRQELREALRGSRYAAPDASPPPAPGAPAQQTETVEPEAAVEATQP